MTDTIEHAALGGDAGERELKPCPFCGSTPELAFSHELGRWDIYEVTCASCDISKSSATGFEGKAAKQSAIAAWNTRTTDRPVGDMAVREAEWQSIETAPRDGTDVLLFYPLEGLDHRTHPQVIIGFWRHNRSFPKVSGWVFQGRARRAYSDCFQPTHWQPLPATLALRTIPLLGNGEG